MDKKTLKIIIVLALIVCCAIVLSNFNFATEENTVEENTILEENEILEENTVAEEPAEEPQIYKISWGEEAIKNGKLLINNTPGITIESNSESGAVYNVKEGTKVDIKCTPNYGYQFTGTVVDSNAEISVTFEPADNIYVYSFIMPACDLTIGDYFTESETEKVVAGNSSIISSIEMPGFSTKGNRPGMLQATWTEAMPKKSSQEEIEALARKNKLKVFDYIDIEVKNLIAKGVTEEYWTNTVSDLGGKTPITITLSADYKDKAPYKVIRYHNEKAEILDAVYDKEKNTITIENNKFSTFALAYESDEVVTENNTASATSNTTNKTNTTNTTNSTNQTNNTNIANTVNNTNTVSNSTASTTTSAVTSGNTNPATGDEIDTSITAFVISVVIMIAIIVTYRMEKLGEN